MLTLCLMILIHARRVDLNTTKVSCTRVKVQFYIAIVEIKYGVVTCNCEFALNSNLFPLLTA